MKRVNARQIYLKYYGNIPLGTDGRPYEVHHIDGNPSNNDISNLKAISIQDHYSIHYLQGDWAACVRIAAKLKLPQAELTEMARRNATKINAKTLKDGTHNFLGKNNHVHAKVANGTHHTLGPGHNLRLLATGKHPSQKLKCCPNCHQVCDSANYARYHGDNCVTIKPRTKYTCVYCGIQAAKHMISRYHNDKCKKIKES